MCTNEVYSNLGKHIDLGSVNEQGFVHTSGFPFAAQLTQRQWQINQTGMTAWLDCAERTLITQAPLMKQKP